MKFLSLAGLAALCVAVTACGKNDTSSTKSAPSCPAGTVCQEALPDSAVAADYFKRTFHYEVLGDCRTDAANVRFAWLGFADRAVLSTNDDGSEVVAELNVFLNDDGSYTGVYQENTQKEIEAGIWDITDSKNRKEIAGTWKVTAVDDQDANKQPIKIQTIEFSNLGQARAVTRENWPGLAIKLGADLNPALKDQTLTLVHVRSNVSKDGKTAADFCATQAAASAPQPGTVATPKAEAH